MTILDRITNIDRDCAEIKRRLSELPDGSVHAYNCRGYQRFRGRLNGEVHHFNRSEMPIVSDLLLKRYLTLRLEDLKTTGEYLRACDASRRRPVGRAERFLIDHPAYAEILKKQFHISVPDLVKSFDVAPYQEKRTEETVLGLMIYFPHFTIHYSGESSVCWFEHFGKMDDVKYRQRNCSKLADYMAHGIIPNTNVAVTFETREHPLGLSQINRAIEMIEQYIR